MLVCGLGAACASQTANRDRNSVARFLHELPACSAPLDAREVDQISEEAATAQVRGLLVRGEATCTLLACTRECCNGCGGRWVLQSPRQGVSDERRRITLVDRDGELMGWSAMDCSLSGLDRDIRPISAVATGAIRKRTAYYGDDNPFELVVVSAMRSAIDAVAVWGPTFSTAC
jgi:hypothetical protein